MMYRFLVEMVCVCRNEVARASMTCDSVLTSRSWIYISTRNLLFVASHNWDMVFIDCFVEPHRCESQVNNQAPLDQVLIPFSLRFFSPQLNPL